MGKIERKQVFRPIECTCGKCGGKAWIVPFGGVYGQTWCPVCTFKTPGASLADMMRLAFSRAAQTVKAGTMLA